MKWETAVSGTNYPNLICGMKKGVHLIQPGEVVAGEVLEMYHQDDEFRGDYKGRMTVIIIRVTEAKEDKSLVKKVYRHFVRGPRRTMLLAYPLGVGDFLQIQYDGRDFDSGASIPPHLIKYNISKGDHPRYVEYLYPKGEKITKAAIRSDVQADAIVGPAAPPPPPTAGGSN